MASNEQNSGVATFNNTHSKASILKSFCYLALHRIFVGRILKAKVDHTYHVKL